MALDIIKVVSIPLVVVINLVVLNQVLMGYTKNQQFQESQTVQHQFQESQNVQDRSSDNFVTNTPSNCLSLNFEEKMDHMLNISKPIFITMAAKVSGTSLKTFTNNCMKRTFGENNFINNADKIQDFFTGSLKLPSVVTSHSYRDDPIISLVKQMSTKALIIYVHRDETERVKSGIAHYVRERACIVHKNLHHNKTHCILDEAHIIQIIQTRKHEIGTGTHDLLTCDTFDALEENAPNMIFIHYKQVNKLQRLIAKNHCPDLVDKPPVEFNVALKKSLIMVVRLTDQSLVSVDNWLDEKIDYLEWALNLKSDIGCQSILRQIEDAMFACPDLTFRPPLSFFKTIMD